MGVGSDDVGALNELSPALARKALARARGHVYDRARFRPRRQIVTYRSPRACCCSATGRR